MFGPGLLGTHGEYIYSSNRRSVNKIFSPGEQHRKQRKMLNPVFSIAHLRDMSKLWSSFWSSRTKCDRSSDFLSCILQGTHSSKLVKLTLTTGQLRDAFAGKVENGPQEVSGHHFSIDIFLTSWIRSRCYHGWLGLPSSLLAKAVLVTPSILWQRTAINTSLANRRSNLCTFNWTLLVSRTKYMF